MHVNNIIQILLHKVKIKANIEKFNFTENLKIAIYIAIYSNTMNTYGKISQYVFSCIVTPLMHTLLM